MDCAICYVSSNEYLLPSIISAAGIRKYVRPDTADIYIFLTATDDALIAEINQSLKDLGILVVGFSAETMREISMQRLEGYITSTTLGRFFIGSLVPESCKHIIYIDGDTWIKGDPSAIINARVPEGKIAAAEDIISFRRTKYTPTGRRILSYFNGLGLSPGAAYFNSGVFSVSKKTWVGLSAEAFTFFKINRELCVCLDQSALNAVTGDRRLRLSMRWNFQSPARFLGIEAELNPVIYHFNQYIKPWMGVCKPWEDVYPEYLAAASRFQSMDLQLPMVDNTTILRHNKMSATKSLLLKYPKLAGLASLYMPLRAYERDVWL